MAAAKSKADSGVFAVKDNKASLISTCKGDASDDSKVISHIFGLGVQQPGRPANGAANEGKDLSFASLPEHIHHSLEEAVCQNKAYIESNSPVAQDAGRMGPETVLLDKSGNSGTLVIEPDRLGCASHSNFSTIRANTCVHKGKWVYELLLGSKGVMQVGWCTLNCKFTQEEGVGDTDDSYAYDGNRLRKWNMKVAFKYGEPWLTGDVVSCCLDCDEGVVTFYRNGESLGEAFDNVQLGPGLAYFPAVSLSLGENVHINFGAHPLKYVIPGHRPIQPPPARSLVQAQLLFSYLRLTVALQHQQANCCSDLPAVPAGDTEPLRSRQSTILLAASHIFDKLGPFLKNAYIVEACLLEHLVNSCDLDSSDGCQPQVSLTLELIWAFLQEMELKACLENLMISLLSAYRFSVSGPGFIHQKRYLTLCHAILSHVDTRKYLLSNILFDKIKFAIFLHVKPPDDVGLSKMIPSAWWGFASKSAEEDEEEAALLQQQLCDEEMGNREQYEADCQTLHLEAKALERIQVAMLRLLLHNDDNKSPPYGVSSRDIFRQKFRQFLKENSSPGTRAHLINQCPLPVSLCFLHRLTRALRWYWDQEHTTSPVHTLPSSDGFVPGHKFYDESIIYFDTQRLGGLWSHLKKTFQAELVQSAEDRRMQDEEAEAEHQAAAHSLVEILDGIILLYSIAAHKQLGKMCALREQMHEYITALADTKKKLAACPVELREAHSELTSAKQVFVDKVTEQARHMAWVMAIIYTKDNQEDVSWLWQVSLRSIQRASGDQEKLFAFVPDFYVDTCIHCYNALRNYFHPTQTYHSIHGFSDVLQSYAVFLSDHFADGRIVNADTKDTIVQALACFICYPVSLHSLESISLHSQVKMVKTLLAPYENRSWAQTNWILVRLWKGCGFGFRYKHLPHLLPAKSQQQEIGSASLQAPCPSQVFQKHIATVIKSNQASATKLIDSLLNQLNWAFSEFIGMLQELQSIAASPSVAFIDSRQLKICATCFDISVGLLRVLEMIVHLTPELLTDWSKPSAELLLCRLCQLLSQVLNRMTSRGNTFDMVVGSGLPGLETVDHYPILTAVTGILVQLIGRDPKHASQDCATAALLAEPGFQVASVEFLLGSQSAAEASRSLSAARKQFSFKNYEDISAEEVQQVAHLVSHLICMQNKSQSDAPEVDEEGLCSICYARPQSVEFQPCGHLSCRTCIIHHLMSNKECFFCKTPVSTVIDLTSRKPISLS